jgi:hypothetical protein
MVELSEGQSIADFAKEWMGKVAEASVEQPEGEKGMVGGESKSRESSDKVEERLGR